MRKYMAYVIGGLCVAMVMGVYAQQGQREKVILWASTLVVLALASYSLYVEGVGVL